MRWGRPRAKKKETRLPARLLQTRPKPNRRNRFLSPSAIAGSRVSRRQSMPWHRDADTFVANVYRQYYQFVGRFGKEPSEECPDSFCGLQSPNWTVFQPELPSLADSVAVPRLSSHLDYRQNPHGHLCALGEFRQGSLLASALAGTWWAGEQIGRVSESAAKSSVGSDWSILLR